MDDLISRQAALKGFTEYSDGWCYINALPSAERKGNWVGIDDEPRETFACDRCGFVLEDWIQGVFYSFCPNCGADMRGGE